MIVRLAYRIVGDLAVKVIMWSICLARNECIFNANIMSAYAIMLKIDHMLLSWFSSVADGTRGKLDDASSAIQCSLEFLGPCVEESGGALPFKVMHEQNTC